MVNVENEHERLSRLAELDADDPEWRHRYAPGYAPGSFGCHELLDRVSLVSKLLEEAVVSHPACVQKPEWYELARRACDALNDLYQNDLYQQVGAEHV